MSQPDKLREFAARNAAELEQMEVELQAQIHHLESVMKPFEKRLAAMKHRAMWLQQARQKLRELDGACRAADPDDIPF